MPYYPYKSGEIPQVGDKVRTSDDFRNRYDRKLGPNDDLMRCVYEVMDVSALEWGTLRLLASSKMITFLFCDLVICSADKPPKAVQKTRSMPCHTEVIKHFGRQDIPQRIIDEAIDRGEKAVRRKLRFWPHGEVLTYESTTAPGQLTIEWRFEKDETENG